MYMVYAKLFSAVVAVATISTILFAAVKLI